MNLSENNQQLKSKSGIGLIKEARKCFEEIVVGFQNFNLNTEKQKKQKTASKGTVACVKRLASCFCGSTQNFACGISDSKVMTANFPSNDTPNSMKFYILSCRKQI